MSQTLYKLSLKCPAEWSEDRSAALASVLESTSQAVTVLRENNNHREAWILSWFFEHQPDTTLIAESLRMLESSISNDDLEIEEVPDIDWLSHNYQQFQPFTVGPFFIYGSHHGGEIPKEMIPMQIDAATAFGSGEHGTTAGCLRQLSALHNDGITPQNILDMGAGSGILAIAAVKLWNQPVLAVDIDAESVRVTTEHAKMNKVGSQVTGLCGDGFNTPRVQDDKPYDLIIANILAGPLIQMAGDLCETVQSNGHVLLSGLLDEQADEVIAAYKNENLIMKTRHNEHGWTTLLLQKN